MSRLVLGMWVLATLSLACSGGAGGGDAGKDAVVEIIYGSDSGATDVDDAASGPKADVDATPSTELPPPCDEGAERCLDEASLERCLDGAWVVIDCTEPCGGWVATPACVDDACQCLDPTSCEDGELTCTGPDTLSTCVDGDWTSTVCSLHCMNQGLASQGCEEGACQCTSSTPDCEEGATDCIAEHSLRRCEEGHWVSIACGQLCAESALESLGCVEGQCL